jgi:hypothetical protein
VSQDAPGPEAWLKRERAHDDRTRAMRSYDAAIAPAKGSYDARRHKTDAAAPKRSDGRTTVMTTDV